MKKSIFFSVFMALLFAIPSTMEAQRFFVSIPLIPTRGAGINIGINIGAPSPNYVWIDGYWDWDDFYGDYVWVPGTWALPPVRGWVWRDGYWENGPRGYAWISGYWANPYRPYSYFGATHRNGGGYAPYFVRNKGDRDRYSAVYVSGNRRFDNNFYYSGRRYNSDDRRNFSGSYDRARRENRTMMRSQDVGRGDNNRFNGSGNNQSRGQSGFDRAGRDRNNSGYGNNSSDRGYGNRPTNNNNGNQMQIPADRGRNDDRATMNSDQSRQNNDGFRYSNQQNMNRSGNNNNSNNNNNNSNSGRTVWRTVSESSDRTSSRNTEPSYNNRSNGGRTMPGNSSGRDAGNSSRGGAQERGGNDRTPRR